MIRKLLYITFLFSLVLVACNPFSDECMYIAGDNDSTIICLESYNAVRINDIFTIYLIQDSTHFIEVVGPENTIAHVQTKLQNDTLSIYNNSECRFLRDYERITLNMHFAELRYIRLIEPSDLITRDTIYGNNITIFSLSKIGKFDLIVNYNSFRFDNAYKNVGEYKISGKVDFLRLYANYGGYVYAENLNARRVDLFMQTKADVHIRPEESLHLWWWENGTVYIYNQPLSLEIMEELSVGKLVFP